MNILKHLSVKMKILLLLVVPVTGMLFFSFQSVMDKSTIVDEMEAVKPLAELAVKASALVHETQKERGATAGFIGSNGKKFATALPAQRINTDNRQSELKAFLEGFDSQVYGAEFSSQLSNALSLLSQIEGKRSAVSALTISGKEAIGYYTSINKEFLRLISSMTKLSSNGEVTREVASYVNFLLGKERAGIERAVLANTFAKDAFGSGMFRKFNVLVSEQNTYAHVFMSLAVPEAKVFYEQTMNDPLVTEVERMRTTAFSKQEGFGIDPVFWFKTQTGKINLLKKVEDWLSNALITHVETLHSEARATQWFFIVMAVGAVVFAIVLASLIAIGITRALGQTLNALNDIAQGEGDLTRRLDDSSRDEIGRVAKAFNQFAGKIEDMVKEVKSSANTINTSASEIAAGNMNLSQRTEEQASSLEETASSMEEMTSAVKQNADNARQANKLAEGARDQAEKGGEVVGNAVTAMSEINASSKKIGDIISVIDEIAFQTNLLALNAAVEAARAGEQGRGFAVVAGEVRTLAQRSAEAAKDIKDLIQDSVEKVEGGTRLVDESGKTLEEIVNSVKKVTDIVSEISASSNEQASGIEQVNKAVMQMDEMTQQNAALVEQASAASRSSEEEAKHLADLVGQFKVSEGSGSVVTQQQSVVQPQQAVSRSAVERSGSDRPFEGKGQPQAAAGSSATETSLSSAKKTGTDDEWSEF